MVPESLLELFDAQVRRPNRPDGFYVSKGWSAVLRPPPDGNVEPLVARMRELPGWVEWKYYSHDLPPDLPERLVAAGLEPEDEETVVVAEAALIAPPAGEFRWIQSSLVEKVGPIPARSKSGTASAPPNAKTSNSAW